MFLGIGGKLAKETEDVREGIVVGLGSGRG